MCWIGIPRKIKHSKLFYFFQKYRTHLILKKVQKGKIKLYKRQEQRIYSSHKILIYIENKTDFKNYIDTTLVKYLDKIKINKWGQKKKNILFPNKFRDQM